MERVGAVRLRIERPASRTSVTGTYARRVELFRIPAWVIAGPLAGAEAVERTPDTPTEEAGDGLTDELSLGTARSRGELT